MSREDKQEKSLHRQSGLLSSQEKKERPQPSLELELLSVCGFCGKLLVWETEWKKTLRLALTFTRYILWSVNVNLYKVYFVFYGMGK